MRACCYVDSSAGVPAVSRNVGRHGASPQSKPESARKAMKSTPLVQFC